MIAAREAIATAPAASRRAAARPAADRNPGFDFTKGVLVMVMVAYHSLNYFHHDKDVLKYLHFLPASFIFITGFLITQVYRPRVLAGETGVCSRVLVRGLKLLAIFVLLNLAAHSLFTSNYNRRELGLDFYLNHLDAIFLTGEQRAAVFEVLLPISYLLLTASALLAAARRFTIALPITAVAGLVFCLYLNADGSLVFNLDLLSVGVLGMLAGLLPMPGINRIARALIPLLLGLVVYQVAVTFIYPTYTMNLVGVPLTLLAIYAIAARMPHGGAFNLVVLLGQYSLIAYIAQIGILQLVFRTFRRTGFETGALPTAFALTLILTVLAVQLVATLRRRSKRAAALYGAVFA